ncbi:tetratricopeptide repeat protein [Rheinheimera gaetbuli]
MKRISGLCLLLLSACAQLPAPPQVIDKPATVPVQTPPNAEPVAMAKTQLNPALQQQFAAAKHMLQAKDYPQALTLFAQLAEQASDAAGIWYNLALAQWHSNDEAAAQRSLQQAISAAPQHSDSHNLLGVLARQRGEMLAAERHFQQALQGGKTYAAAHKNLAFLYELYLAAPLQAHYHYQQYYQLTQDEQVTLWLALLEQELAQQDNSATDSTVQQPLQQENSND